MLAAVLAGSDDLEAREVPTPSAGPDEALVRVGAKNLRHRENLCVNLRIVGSELDGGLAEYILATALRLIESGRIDTASMITHRVPLAGVAEAIRMVVAGEGVKVAVLP